MRVSMEWLKTLVDLKGLSASELAAQLVRTGTEVESIETEGESLDRVVVGLVETCVDHPDSDHMHLLQVNVGSASRVNQAGNASEEESQLLQIVCGAPNIAAGQKVLVAMIGAVLPGDFKIKAAKLRGVASHGMVCSERELGLGSEHDGIMVLPADAPIGMAAADYLGAGDTVLDCEITPNRPDCLNMEGFAREVSATIDSALLKNEKKPAAADSLDAPSSAAANASMRAAEKNNPSLQKEYAPATQSYVEVQVASEERCARYVARVAEHIKIQPSPDWLQKRLISAGTRPINNVVDITNYVMYLTGQPLHAFDYHKLQALSESKKPCVCVRPACDGEVLKTLDGEERTLSAEATLISVERKGSTVPVALAGVMGGANSEIDDATTSVFLESAAFAPAFTSRTSRNLNLMSEASIRFERGVDAAGCLRAADIACALLEKYAAAHIAEKPLDVYPHPVEPSCITLSCEHVNALVGAEIPPAFVQNRLEKLGCTVKETHASPGGGGDETVFSVEVSTTRPDLTREVDLIEEVLRLWGMDKIEPMLPAAKNHAGGYKPQQTYTYAIKDSLESSGLSETVSFNFSSPQDLELLGLAKPVQKNEGAADEAKAASKENAKGAPGASCAESYVELLSPLSKDLSVMRKMLLPGLLRAVAFNLAHGTENVALYEQGRLFFPQDGTAQPAEPTYLGGVLCGQWQKDSWDRHPVPLDFFDAKGVLENLFDVLNITKVRFRPIDAHEYPYLFPGRAAQILVNKRSLGWVGNIHPQVLKRFDIEKDVVAFEIDQDALLSAIKKKKAYHEISAYPTTEADLAFVVAEDVTYLTCLERLRSAGGALLRDVRLFDIYRDPQRVGKDKKSLAFSLTFGADDRTLKQEEVEEALVKIREKITKSLGAEMRV